MNKEEPTEKLTSENMVGAWTIEWIGPRPVMDYSPAYFDFAPDGSLSGSASCNRLFGKYTLGPATLKLSIVGTTRKMCPPALMEQEQRLMEAAPLVTAGKISQSMLVLLDEEGTEVFRASRRKAR